MQKLFESKVLLLVAVAAAVGLLLWGLNNRIRVAELRAELADAKLKMADMVAKEELETAHSRVEELERRSPILNANGCPLPKARNFLRSLTHRPTKGKRCSICLLR